MGKYDVLNTIYHKLTFSIFLFDVTKLLRCMKSAKFREKDMKRLQEEKGRTLGYSVTVTENGVCVLCLFCCVFLVRNNFS